MFITCSDSRVVPSLLTQTDPGQLFIIRNAGNIVPVHSDNVSGEEATIEYALEALKIKNIVVCGHTKCGAMTGVLKPEILSAMPNVEKWLAGASKSREVVEKHYPDLDHDGKHSVIVQENVLMQLENVRSLTCVLTAVKYRSFWVGKSDSPAFSPCRQTSLASTTQGQDQAQGDMVNLDPGTHVFAMPACAAWAYGGLLRG